MCTYNMLQTSWSSRISLFDVLDCIIYDSNETFQNIFAFAFQTLGSIQSHFPDKADFMMWTERKPCVLPLQHVAAKCFKPSDSNVATDSLWKCFSYFSSHHKQVCKLQFALNNAAWFAFSHCPLLLNKRNMDVMLGWAKKQVTSWLNKSLIKYLYICKT